MKILISAILLLVSVITVSSAQDFPYGTITVDEMNMKNYANDTSAHAVVLKEFGKSSINIGGDDNMKQIYEYHVKIKIFDAKAFDKGTVKILLYSNDKNDAYEEVSNIQGVTYYKDDNGFTQKAE